MVVFHSDYNPRNLFIFLFGSYSNNDLSIISQTVSIAARGVLEYSFGSIKPLILLAIHVKVSNYRGPVTSKLATCYAPFSILYACISHCNIYCIGNSYILGSWGLILLSGLFCTFYFWGWFQHFTRYLMIIHVLLYSVLCMIKLYCVPKGHFVSLGLPLAVECFNECIFWFFLCI